MELGFGHALRRTALLSSWIGSPVERPAPGTHEEFMAPLWKHRSVQPFHCIAGDATGIIVAATITSLLGLPMGLDAAVEYIAGFVFGLLIFQALFMKDMLGVLATGFSSLLDLGTAGGHRTVPCSGCRAPDSQLAA